MDSDPDRKALVDEIGRLRRLLEAAVAQSARLVEERDHLRERLRQLGQELHETREAALAVQGEDHAQFRVQHSRIEEELRVAVEELQGLTDELGQANSRLHEANAELDARVEERTRQLSTMNASLRLTEASLQVIADVVPDLLWRTDHRGRADWYNKRWFAYTGQDEHEALGTGWLKAVHPEDRAGARAAWQSAVDSGTPYHHEQRIGSAAGAFRWFLIRAVPLRDEVGRIVSWFGSCTDMHDQRIALEALQRSESRFRTLVEGMPQLVWRAVGLGHWTWSSPQWSVYTGQSGGAAMGEGWQDMLHPDDREPARAAWREAQHRGELDMEGRLFHQSEQRYRHFRTRALPVRDTEGRVIEWLGTSTDIDDLRQLQGEQSVLVAELQHRTRNLMAMVRTITSRTIQGTASFEAFAERIDARFAALARVQALLSRREGAARVHFDVLLREEISAHVELDGRGHGRQVTLEGPSGIPLLSSNVQTLALALHELATNAAKYGALAQPGGHLHIAWSEKAGGSRDKRLCVDWRETGVAGIPDSDAAAKGGGYGRELIERALPYQLGARTTYDFEPDGVHCTIEVTIPASGGVEER